MGEFALGQPVSRFEDPRLLRGGGRYVDDIVLPRMAYGFVLRSPHAHARIARIDTRDAKAAPGVLAVLTGADWEASGWGDLPVPTGMKRRDGSPSYKPRFPALVTDRVRWVGDYVAFVVAATAAQAADAVELIHVDYEPLPAIISSEKAVQPGAIQVWDDCPNNICFVHLEGSKAATDEAFARADKIVKRRFVINRVTAATMEPRGALGDYNAAEDRYTIYTTLQRTHPYRAELSNYVLKVPESKIRVVAGDIGGSFGMKSAVYNEVALVLLASKLTGRPVKWTSTRSEAFVSDAQARDNITDAELALDKDGHFLGFRVKTIANLGAYLQMNSNVFVGNLGTLAGVYRTPAIHADVTAVFTHTNPVRPYRGNGRPEAAYVIERIVDCAAKELGLDPLELRRRNIIPPEAMPFKSGLTFTYDCGEFAATLAKAERAADMAGFPARRDEAKKRHKLRGLGLSNTIERAAAPGFEAAEVRFDSSGTVTLLSGSITQGQGHETIYKQILCDRLGLKPDQVHYVQGDTDKVAVGQGTGGSRSATLGGSAVLAASDKIVAKGKTIAAKLMGVDAGEVKFEDGVFSSTRSNRTLTIGEIAKESLNPRSLPDDQEPGLIATAMYTAKVENFPNGCHVCELEIDEETGIVDIMRYSVVDDVGTVMNPLLLEGQVSGGIVQGIGQVLMEDIRFDPASGQLLTGSFMDYAMPRAGDVSAIEIDSHPVPTKTNPLGVKGAGEAGSVGALPAVGNALIDALSVLGIDDVPMPATPERLWRAMREARR
ncbi:MAG TPA: xanthine dehydrogenase family protein molybdopterin-binding subunit [Stellaceae bacterium]|jgi:carbon-monoxide dehydrogenase large subunit|nr:xanthine dehydrogenase family protein molybdopterin-binding subunit [Stellaceae bacterium]